MQKSGREIPKKKLAQHFRIFRIWLAYKIDQWISGGFWRMVALLGFVIIASAVFLAVVRHNSMTSLNEEWTESLWLTLFNTLDAGVIADSSQKPSRGIMIFATIIGLLILSTLIGLIASKINERLTNLRRGRTSVHETDHVLILGWNNAIFDLVREIHMSSSPDPGPRVVVLAHYDNLMMMEDLNGFIHQESIKQAQAGIPKRRRIQKPVTRFGLPWDRASLELVRPREAKWILILTDLDDPSGKDATTIKTLLALDGMISKHTRTNIVASICSHVNKQLAMQAAKSRAQVVDSDQIIARLLVQTCRQIGLGQVISDLTSFEGFELYRFQIGPELTGHTLREFVRGTRNHSVVGYQQQGNPPILLGESPQQFDIRLVTGDKLWILAKDPTNALNFSLNDSLISEERIQPAAIIPPKPNENKPEIVLIIGWNRRGSLVLYELDQHVVLGSTVLVFDPGGEGLERGLQKEVKKTRTNIQVSALHIEEDIADWLELYHNQNQNLSEFDHIIILDDDNFTSQGHSADLAVARVVLELRKLRAEFNGRWPRIVCEVSDERTRQLIRNQEGEEFIASGRFVVSLMVQFALDSERSAIYESIFDALGSEICTRAISEYVDVALSPSWSTVVEAALRRGEVAIGWLIFGPNGEYAVHFNPQLENLNLKPTSTARIILLASR